MSIEERERALLRLVKDYQDSEGRSILESARVEARRLVEEAYQHERARLHARVLAERAGARARVQAVRAERETRARARREQLETRLLAIARTRLRELLEQCWSEARWRDRWARQAFRQARATLPPGLWKVRHPPGWTEAQWAPMALRLTSELGTRPQFRADEALVAGLTIASGSALLDASLEGLLQDRQRIESRLLALLRASTPDDGGQS